MVIDVAETSSADLEGDQAKAYDAARLSWQVRIIEPHDHGILNGSVQLLAWQVAGFSSRPLPNWLLMKVDEMVELTTLPDKFSGGRSTGSGEHVKWDKLFIRVQPTDEAADASSVQTVKPRLAF